MSSEFIEVDGETRIMRPDSLLSPEEKLAVTVEAERLDCDTPFVNLTVMSDGESVTISMTDVLAEDVAKRIKRALRILPTSK